MKVPIVIDIDVDGIYCKIVRDNICRGYGCGEEPFCDIFNKHLSTEKEKILRCGECIHAECLAKDGER